LRSCVYVLIDGVEDALENGDVGFAFDDGTEAESLETKSVWILDFSYLDSFHPLSV
jgi:hypothetical protein